MRITRALATLPLVLAVSIPAVMAPAPAVGQTIGSELCDTVGVEQFTDVQAVDYAAAYILCMRALGLSQGLGNGDYGADRLLTRGQMATFLVRLWTDVLDRECPDGVASPFTDTAGTTHADSIDCIYGLGITTGTTPTTYSPQGPLKASHISRFLFRTYQRTGTMCPAATAASELDRAVSCLLDRRVVPTEAEAAAATPVTRPQMAVYMIGLWHNLTGRGLPPPPPQLDEPTPQRSAANLPTLQIAYTAEPSYRAGPWSPDSTRMLYHAGLRRTHVGARYGVGDLWVVNADGTGAQQLTTDAREEPVWSPDSTGIVYRHLDNGLWVMRADGSGKQQLSARGWDVAWSPDSTGLLFEDSEGLWVVDKDGTGKQQLSAGGEAGVWSPDSTRILFQDYDRGGGLWVVNTDGTGRQQLTTTRRFETRPASSAWSPDSTKILYSHIVYGGSTGIDEMWVVNADGTNPQQLIAQGDGLVDYYSVVWSPDSSRVLSARNDGGIWAANTDGTSRQLTSRGKRPQFSPDGAGILYHDSASPWLVGALRVMDADGSNQRQLTAAAKGPIVWSPDSTEVTYNDGNDRVWVVNADGTDQRQVVSVPCERWLWSADGTRILYSLFAGGYWVASADGTDRRKLIDSGYQVAFSPDAANVVYTDSRGALWFVHHDGTNRKQLTATRGAWIANSDATGRQQLTADGSVISWSPDGTRILYTTEGRVWVANADGTNRQDLFRGAAPRWSPDSTKILYRDNFYDQVTVVNADGSWLGFGLSGARAPQWSPDSTRIAYVHDTGLRVASTQAELTQLISTTGAYMAWSPDGTKINYVTDNGLWVVNADGTNRKQLTTQSNIRNSKGWSPDGTKIAYYTDYEIWVVNADGTNRKQVVDAVVINGFAWSPDSRKISYTISLTGVFESEDPDPLTDKVSDNPDNGLWVMNADGTNLQQLVHHWYIKSAAWSPDGTRIAYREERDVGRADDDALWVINTDGTNPRQLTNQDFFLNAYLSWSPDGTRIAYLADGLWVVNADGTNRTQIDRNGADPQWSPAVASGGG